MGKIGKVILVSFIIGLTLCRIFHKEDLLFRIYTQNNKDIYYLIGFLPENIRDNYVKTPIENNGIGKVYILRNKYDFGTYLIYEDSKEADFMVVYPPSLICSRKELKNLQYKDYVSYMVNLKVFNRYLRDSQIEDKEKIKAKYFEFVARGETPYHIIRDTTDISYIKRQFTTYPNGYATLENLNPHIINNKKADFCWYESKGVVQFQFHFCGNNIEAVNSKIIGYLGNEFISIY